MENSILQGKKVQSYTLAKRLAQGGEGEIYSLQGKQAQVAKIYKPNIVTKTLEQKILSMLENPPSKREHIAWPVDVLFDKNNQFMGFVMDKLDTGLNMKEIYGYDLEKEKKREGVLYTNKVIVAQNICLVLESVHEAGYVFGDFNDKNICVSESGFVSFFDADSYQFQNKSGTYRCHVAVAEYIPPEIHRAYEVAKEKSNGKKVTYGDLPFPTFTPETDRFALAIHIYQLLMNGFHPFNGMKHGGDRGAPQKKRVDSVKENLYCFKTGLESHALPVPRKEEMPDYIMNLFDRAFLKGHENPKERPTPKEWYQALMKYEKELVSCSVNSFHEYHKKNSACPFCAGLQRQQNVVALQPTQRSFAQQQKATPRGTTHTGTTTTSSGGSSGLVSGWFMFFSTCLAGIFAYFVMKMYNFNIYENTQLLDRLAGGYAYNVTSAIAPYALISVAMFTTLIYSIALEKSGILPFLASVSASVFGLFFGFWILYFLAVVVSWGVIAVGIILCIVIIWNVFKFIF